MLCYAVLCYAALCCALEQVTMIIKKKNKHRACRMNGREEGKKGGGGMAGEHGDMDGAHRISKTVLELGLTIFPSRPVPSSCNGSSQFKSQLEACAEIEARGATSYARYSPAQRVSHRTARTGTPHWWITVPQAPRASSHANPTHSSTRSLVHSLVHSSLSRCSSRDSTTCLLVSSISPAKKTSSSIAYTL